MKFCSQTHEILLKCSYDSKQEAKSIQEASVLTELAKVLCFPTPILFFLQSSTSQTSHPLQTCRGKKVNS